MKCTHIRLKSPLRGLIRAEELFRNTSGKNGGFQLNNGKMAEIMENGSALAEFLEDNVEDLAEYIHDDCPELKEVVKLMVGDYAILDDGLYLIHHAYVRGDYVDDRTITKLKEYLMGQLSDGWGEGLEQRVFYDERVEWEVPFFSECDLEFQMEPAYDTAEYYVDPWWSGMEIEEMDREECDLHLEPQKVAEFDNTNSKGYKRTVYLVKGRDELQELMNEVNTDDAARNAIDQWGIHHRCAVLIVVVEECPESGEKYILTNLYASEEQKCGLPLYSLHGSEATPYSSSMTFEEVIIRLLIK